MIIKWVKQTCVAKEDFNEDGVLDNGMVAFSLLKYYSAAYWELEILFLNIDSLFFTSEEAAKKEAHEIVNGRSKLKLY